MEWDRVKAPRNIADRHMTGPIAAELRKDGRIVVLSEMAEPTAQPDGSLWGLWNVTAFSRDGIYEASWKSWSRRGAIATFEKVMQAPNGVNLSRYIVSGGEMR